MKCFKVSLFLFCIILPLAFSRHVEFFRKDYTYIEEYDAFYKMHWDKSVTTWKTAFLTCDEEDATLFYPKLQDEWNLVKSLADNMIEDLNTTEILVGLHDEFNLGEFITVDGHATPSPLPSDQVIRTNGHDCITMNINTGKFSVKSCLFYDSPLPFVCKKVDVRVREESCPTVDQGYKFVKTLKKCYKISEKRQTWQEAMKTCFMEGGTLAVLDNPEQANQIRIIIDNSQTYFVGVRKLLPEGDFYSIRGKKFSDMYQLLYNNGQNQFDNSPNPDENSDYPDENGNYPEFRPRQIVREPLVELECGTVCNHNTGNIYTETHNCDDKLPFICEMEVRA
ncbi:hypothetical protein PYW07_008399 [Mythimna separata]|uniref:C-type lectin domain-containing protein n=1 Tax=Mythimna separata TaxID=271217 RepID=A0AAD7YDG7_MYTSE|nr:hypothetical protein PYW07_008399 [Mythimna separata]